MMRVNTNENANEYGFRALGKQVREPTRTLDTLPSLRGSRP